MTEVTVRAAHRVIGLTVGDEVRVEETAKVKRLIDGGHLEVVTRHRGRKPKDDDKTDDTPDPATDSEPSEPETAPEE